MSAEAIAWLEEQSIAYPWAQQNRMDIVQTKLFDFKNDHETRWADDGWCPICSSPELIVLDYLDA